jgi:hypothetical protein
MLKPTAFISASAQRCTSCRRSQVAYSDSVIGRSTAPPPVRHANTFHAPCVPFPSFQRPTKPAAAIAESVVESDQAVGMSVPTAHTRRLSAVPWTLKCTHHAELVGAASVDAGRDIEAVARSVGVPATTLAMRIWSAEGVSPA